MFQAQIRKRLIPRFSQRYFGVVPLIQILMRAITIITESGITVMAKNSKTIREIVIFKPSRNAMSAISDFLSMLCTVAVGMVNRQKLKIGFSATIAFWCAIAVMTQYFVAEFFIKVFGVLAIQFLAFSVVPIKKVFFFSTLFTNRLQRTRCIFVLFTKILRRCWENSTTRIANFLRWIFNYFMSGTVLGFQHTHSAKATESVALRTVFIKISNWLCVSTSRAKLLLYNYFSHSVHSFIVNNLARLVRGVSDFVQAVFIVSQNLVLQVDADGKSVSFESYNQSDACFYLLQQVQLLDIKSACVEFFGVSHDRLIARLYNSLRAIFKFTSGLRHHQICYALDLEVVSDRQTSF